MREWRRESLWLWPTIAAVAVSVGGDLAARDLRSFTLHQGLFPTNLDDARTLLATIATALLTFTGVVFSITLVALQMASTQYSPRVLRTFVRKPVTKLALSTFFATFVYSLTLLARVGATGKAHTVAQGAVGLAYLLVTASVIVFVIFVHSTVRSMRVTYIIQAVFNETLGAARSSFAEASAYRDTELPEVQPITGRIAFERRDATLNGIDAHRLVELASAHDCMLRLCVPVGTYVRHGEDVFEVLGGTSPGPAEILKAMNCSPARTLYQDPSYGVRQLVDIAIWALSSAVNDPRPRSSLSIDCTGSCVPLPAGQTPWGCYLDHSGAVRLMEPVAGWDRLVDLAFTEIGLCGSGSPQVTRKLFALFDDLDRGVPPDRRPSLDALRAWLRAEVARRPRLPGDRAFVADPLGLG
jgi:uncharacterized membrane protein